jgi:WD40 repeat protein
MGKVERLDFYDAATLYATGMPYYADVQFSLLLVQFTSKIILLNLKQGPIPLALDATLRQQVNPTSREPWYQPIVAQIGEATLKATPSSMAVPLSPSLLLLGCSDGSIRIYDWTKDKFDQVRTKSSGKSDAIWHLMPTNPYNNNTNNNADAEIVRVTSISKKATAYLRKLNLAVMAVPILRLPLGRMDGLFVSATASSESKNSGSVSPSGTTTSASGTQSGSGSVADTPWDHTLIDFDAHRQLLMWFVPSGYKNSSRPHVLVWDLTLALTKKKTTVHTLEPCCHFVCYT